MEKDMSLSSEAIDEVLYPKIEHGDAAREVDVAVAFHVPQFRVFGAVRVNAGGDADASGRGGLTAFVERFVISHLVSPCRNMSAR